MTQKRQQTRYTEEERATALAILKSTGGNFARAAEAADVPDSTLRNWAKGIGVVPPELVTEKTEALADVFDRVARLCLAKVEKALEPEGAKLEMLKDYMTSAAIATDKHQLLTGKPTSRDEHQFPEGEATARRDMLREMLKVERGGRKAG